MSKTNELEVYYFKRAEKCFLCRIVPELIYPQIYTGMLNSHPTWKTIEHVTTIPEAAIRFDSPESAKAEVERYADEINWMLVGEGKQVYLIEVFGLTFLAQGLEKVGPITELPLLVDPENDKWITLNSLMDSLKINLDELLRDQEPEATQTMITTYAQRRQWIFDVEQLNQIILQFAAERQWLFLGWLDTLETNPGVLFWHYHVPDEQE